MMTTDGKRHIDAARQVLVGVVPNPTSQIDQITNALIYKFMDDMDQSAIKAGGKASFFVGELARYAWTRLMDPRIGNQERMNLYVEALAKFPESKKLPDLFREILREAFLPYRSPEVLGLFLKEIDYFDYSHPEELGNAYEYLLSIMSSQGDAGQFRTPRHIIDFIVDVVNPTKEDKVLDPACGTGGFLVKSYLHILEQHDGKNPDGTKNNEKPLTPDEKRKLMNNFEGYDIDPGMVRIAQVNMYLHQFKSPRIYNYNTLSNEERWGDKFDVMLANPPFMSPKGGVRPHNKFSVQSNRSEVLFVDYIMSHLRPKGRAGIIVPEGIIFQSGTAHKQLRKNLIEDGLYAVVSLPSGVFSPYSGVKTSVLFFDNDLVKKRDELLFIKVENDGFDLGATKKPIDKNDLPESLEILRKWKQGKKTERPRAVYVLKSKIAEDGDYNLSGGRYRVAADYSHVKWPMIKLEEVADLVRGSIYTKDDEVDSGGHKVLRANNISLNGNIIYDDVKHISINVPLKDTQVLKKGDIFICLASGSKDHIGKVAYINEDLDFYFGGFMGVIRPKNNAMHSKYLYYLLRSAAFNEYLSQAISGANINNLNATILGRYQIPSPPLEVQKQVVEGLDGYQNIISGARKVVESWKPRIQIDPAWGKEKLGTLLNRVSEQIDPRGKGGEAFYVGLENIESNSGALIGNPIAKYSDIKSLKNIFIKGDLLYGKLRPNLNKVWLADREGICSTDILVFRGTERAITNFYWYLLLSGGFVSEVMTGIKGAQLPRVGFEHLKEILLPAPPIEIQERIVGTIESERELVKSNRKLIEIYEQKTKEAISKLWNE